MGKRIKYMGSADTQTLVAGDDFGGRLGEGIPQEVVFSRKNNWVVDTDEAGLTESAVEVLVSTADFKDVTDLERIPLNRNQTLFLGMKDGDKVPSLDAEEEDLQYAAPEGDPDEQAKREAVAAEAARLEAEEAKRIADAEAEAAAQASGKKK